MRIRQISPGSTRFALICAFSACASPRTGSPVSLERSAQERAEAAEHADAPGSALPHAGVAPARATIALSLPQSDLEARFGVYQVRDSVWVSNQPVIVGREYDFSFALSGDTTAPGIAALRRQQGNEALAKELSGTGPLAMSAELESLRQRCRDRCPQGLVSGESRLYAFLFGDAKARLRVVLETPQNDGTSLVRMSVSAPRPAGDYANDTTLIDTFKAGVEAIATAFSTPAVDPREPTQGNCNVGDRSTVTGTAVSLLPTQVILASRETPVVTYVVCPLDAYVPQSGVSQALSFGNPPSL